MVPGLWVPPPKHRPCAGKARDGQQRPAIFLRAREITCWSRLPRSGGFQPPTWGARSAWLLVRLASLTFVFPRRLETAAPWGACATFELRAGSSGLRDTAVGGDDLFA